MFALLIVAAVYAWKFERLENPEKKGIDFLSDLRENELTRISIVRPAESFSLVRPEGNGISWVLKEPAEAPIDPKKASNIFQALGKLQRLDTIEPDEVERDEGVYGLRPPELVLTVDGSFGRKVLSFGKKIVMTNRRYAQPEGEDQILLVPEEIFTALDIKKDDIRDKFPVKFRAERVQEFVVNRGDNDSLRFLRKDKWRVQSQGKEFPADHEFVEKKLRELEKIRVKKFIDEPGGNLSLYGLSLPRLVVKLEEGEGSEPFIFQIGEGVSLEEENDTTTGDVVATKGYFLKIFGQPFIYQLERAYTGDLLQSADYFRPKEPFPNLEPAQLEKIEIALHGDDHCAAQRFPDENWKVNCHGAPSNIGKQFIETWLRGVRLLQVLSYPGFKDATPEDTGLNLPTVSYKFHLKDRESPLVLALGSPLKTGKTGANSELAPSWIAVSQEDGAIIPAIVNSEMYGILFEFAKQLSLPTERK